MIVKTATIAPQKASYVYRKQQFFADRAAQINAPKSVQIGVRDNVSISPVAQALATASGSSTAITKNSITYDDPRKAMRTEKRAVITAVTTEATGRGQRVGAGRDTGYLIV